MSDQNMRLRFIQDGKVLILDRVSMELSPEDVRDAIGGSLPGVSVLVFAEQVDVPETDRFDEMPVPAALPLLTASVPVDERADYEGRIANLEGLIREQSAAWDAERAEQQSERAGSAATVVYELADRFGSTNRGRMSVYLRGVGDALLAGRPWPELAVKPPVTDADTANAFAAGVRAGLTRVSEMAREAGMATSILLWLRDCIDTGMERAWPSPQTTQVRIQDNTLELDAAAVTESEPVLLGDPDDDALGDPPVGSAQDAGVISQSTLTASELRQLTGDTTTVGSAQDTFVVGSASDMPPAGDRFNLLLDVDPANSALPWLVRVKDETDHKHSYQPARWRWFRGLTQYTAWWNTRDARPSGDTWEDLGRGDGAPSSFVVRVPTTDERATWRAS